MNWIYIGGFNSIKRVEGVLKKENKKFIGKDIENITDSVRDNFIDFIGKISLYQQDKVIWYSSRVASKSISQTTIFQQYVYLKLLERLSGAETQDMVVVIESLELLRNVRRIYSSTMLMLTNDSLAWQDIKNGMKRLVNVIRYFFAWIICKTFKNSEISQYRIFIHSWVNDKVFSRLPYFVDSNFGHLEDLITRKGYRVARLMPLFLPVKYIIRLKKEFRNIIYLFYYVKLTDFVEGLFKKFHIDDVPDTELKDILDLRILRILLKSEAYKETHSLYFLNYYLSYCAYKNLSHVINSRAIFIYPFENQPWEKVFNLALSGFKRIGYQHTTMPLNWLDYRISFYEKDNSPLPQVILASGKKWAHLLREYYNNSVAVKESGTFRFPYLFDSRKRTDSTSKEKGSNIVIALPISESISLSLQDSFLAAIEGGRVDLLRYNIRIKPHPYLHRRAILKKAFSKYKNCFFVTEGISELLKDCELLITSASTVAFESVMSAVKTVYFIPEDISWGQDYFIREHLFVAYEEDFAEKILSALKSEAYPRVSIDEYYSQPDFNILLDSLD